MIDYNEQRADDAGYPEGRPTAPSDVNRAAIANRELAERKRIFDQLLANERAADEQAKLATSFRLDAEAAELVAAKNWSDAWKIARDYLAAHPEIEED